MGLFQLVSKNPQCSINFTTLIGKPGHAVKGSTTYLPNAKGRAAATSVINATSSSAPRILLSPASHIAETADNEIKVVIVPPALHPMVAAPPTTARTKKKRKKTTSAAAPASATDNTLATTPTLPTTPTTKKGKKKSTKPINLWTSPIWVSTADLTKHRVVAVAHKQKWVAGNNETITADAAEEPLFAPQWHQKGPFGKKIAPSNPDFVDMSPLNAFTLMMPPEQLDLNKINKRLNKLSQILLCTI